MENKQTGSVEAGSPEEIIKDGPNPNDFEGGTGEPSVKKEEPKVIDPAQHAELEKKLGEQGEEIGELRKFFKDITPILDKLEGSPELVKAIVDGKLTPELAKAAIEGKISVKEAEIVSEAEKEVKKDLGKDAKGTSKEDVNKLVEEKIEVIEKKFEKQLKERDELNDFESSVNQFIARTSDFNKYAKEIDTWLDKHDITDIAVAYYAVKGELSEKEAKKQAEIDKAEAEKSGALVMGGGEGSATRIKGDTDILDKLVAGKSNPNVF